MVVTPHNPGAGESGFEPGMPVPSAPAEVPVMGQPQVHAAPVEEFDEFAGYVDYFGFDEREIFYLPDGKQWIQFKKLTEGERAQYLRASRSDVTVNRRTSDAKISFDQSEERINLLTHSITNWNLHRKVGNAWRPVPFSKGSQGAELEKWIRGANPAILAQLEKRIRLANPWLLSEMTVEQLDKEIADLTELRAVAVEREALEKSSAVK